jgi:endo-1,4-beta-mannosidase
MPNPDCSNARGDFVTASSTALCLAGQPYRFVGVNRYDLLSSPRYTCGRRYDDAELERWASEAAGIGARVIRTWAFSAFTDGGRDFSPLDRVLDAARRHDLRLVLTLDNEWKDCGDPDPTTPDGRKGRDWFAGGWEQTLRPYLETVVARYADEPRVLAWQLMNEAECPDADALHDFATRTSAAVKAIDRNHLVSLGTIGTGQAGTVGDDYHRLHEIADIDLVEAHDYHAPQSAWPSAIAGDLDVARAVGKPFFIGEAGISAPRPDFEGDPLERAAWFDAKINAAIAAGVSGYLIWSFYDLSAAPTGWDFSPADPLAAVMSRAAKSL